MIVAKIINFINKRVIHKKYRNQLPIIHNISSLDILVYIVWKYDLTETLEASTASYGV